MPEKVMPGPIQSNACFKEAVCIHTKKVYDSCRDKDCLEDLKVFLTRESQCILERAINVKPRTAEILWIYIDVEPVPFNKGFYTIDIKYFYRITCDAFVTVGRPCIIEGLATFDKRVILFGSEGSIRIFSSDYKCGESDKENPAQDNLPTAIVEVVEPIMLSAKVVEPCGCDCGCGSHYDGCDIPHCVACAFESDIMWDDGHKKLLVTLGQFSIVKLERDSQLLIPCYDFCMPEKECIGTDENPCSLFNRLSFPTDEFFPKQLKDWEGGGIIGKGPGPGPGCCKK